MIQWSKDIGRTLDYLESRTDIDSTRLAYYGLSSGARDGPIFADVEGRFKAGVLLAGGLDGENWELLPEVNVVNFAPKETVLSKREIGSRLRAARQRKDVTQARLAAILGTNQSHVSNVERGELGLTIQQLVKICRALKISPEEILGKGEAAEERPLRDRRLLRRLRQIEQLPNSERKALLKTIDAFLKSSRVA